MRIERSALQRWVRGERFAGAWWVALGAWLAIGGVGAAQQFRPAPPFEGKVIPMPPGQGQAWIAPASTLPKFLTTSTATLFEQGVADPRGCEYRLVETSHFGSVGKDRGFVLPERADAPGRFFVGWDGLVYPASTIGEPLDLDRDIRDRAASFRRAREGKQLDQFHQSISWSFPPVEPNFNRGGGVADHSPIKLCLLLRLGRADLAETLFAAGTSWTPGPRSRDLTDYGFNYLTLANDWATSAFSRLIGAHIRGEDGIALDTARKLAKFRDLATARADALGFPRGDRQNGFGNADIPPGRFPMLGQLDDLLQDHERRAKLPPRGPIPPRGGDPSARIAALIRDLDQINEQQMMSPGSASPGDSPLVSDLVAEGDPAVAPLLAVLGTDDRLTRSVSHGRGRSVDSFIHLVHEAAFAALTRILQTNEFENQRFYGWKQADPATRKALASSIRQFWEKTRSIPLVERWYRTLLDDSAGSARWLEAAGGITQMEVEAGMLFPKPGTRPMLGEALRVGRDPSVTALLLRRAGEVERSGVPQTSYDQGFGAACQLGSMLTTWDAAASLSLLQHLCQGCRTRSDRWQDNNQNMQFDSSLASNLAKFTQTRVGLGDLGALDEYAGWLRTTTPKMLEYGTFEALKPLLAQPDHPALASAARWLFNDLKSPWVPLLPEDRGARAPGFQNLFDSPLVTIDGFREGVLAALGNKAQLGTIEQAGKNSLRIKIKEGPNTNLGSTKINLDGILTGVKYPFRVCDLVASRLSSLEGSPQCELIWPEARRDEAVAACVAYLKRFGEFFSTEAPVDANDFPEPKAHLKFPTLDHPATAADVVAGRAIFSLAGEGETRQVKLPKLPQKAKWTTLKDTPVDRTYSNDGITRREYDTDGYVWQAEEVLRDGRWERSYGFVGHHTVARAPAAEIEFSSQPYLWRNLPGGLDGLLELVVPRPARFEPGQPVLVVTRIRNRLGVAQSCPTEFLRLTSDGKPALRQGIKLSLWHSPPSPRSRSRWGQEPPGDPVEPRRDARFVADQGSRPLEPLEPLEAIRFDVNDWFDLSRPGRYRLRVDFTPEAGIGAGAVGEVLFQVGGDPE